MKKCPYCAEEIQEDAIVCKHCGRELVPDQVAEVSQRLSQLSHEAPDTDSIETTNLHEPELAGNNQPRPAARIALIVGGFFALVAAAMVLMDPLSNLVGGAYLAGNLLLNVLVVFGITAGSTYVLIRLWRWKKWASIALAIGLPLTLCAAAIWIGGIARSVGSQTGNVRLFNPKRSHAFLYQDSSWGHYQVAPNGTMCEHLGNNIWLRGVRPVLMSEVRCGGATASKWVESAHTR